MSNRALDSNNALEAALGRAADRPRFLTGPAPDADAGRAAMNFAAIEAELDAPPAPRLARVLRAVGVPDRTVPLITATPGLRRSWLISVVVAILFAVNAATTSTAEGVERITAFLTVAPLVPLLGVALAFGPGVDPTHDTAVAAPIDGFRLFLIRSVTVLSASSLLLLAGAGLVPAGGAYRFAWLLPALAVTTVTLALATRLDPRVAAGIVAVGWLFVMLVANNRADATGAFGAGLQVTSLVVAAVGAAVFVQQRRRLDVVSSEP